MSSDLIQEYRDTVFTEFNSELRPWRLYTTSIYHDPSLITDISYLTIASGFDAHANTLNIEASGSDINFYTNNNFTTNFNNGVTFSDSMSIPGNLNLTGIMNVSGGIFSDGTTSFRSLTFGNTDSMNTLPYGRGISGQYLSTNGGGVLDWVDISGSTKPAIFGIVQPEKAVIVNDYRDISGFRNITIDGKFESKNYKFDIYGNVSGLGTVGAGDISSIGIIECASIRTDGTVESGDISSVGIIECASIRTDGTLTGPSTFIIDPAAHGDNTGMVEIKGSLHVYGSSLSMQDTLKLTENLVSVGKNTSATQTAYSIVLNASGSTLNSATTGFFVKPIRSVADVSTFQSLFYDITTGEVSSKLVSESLGATIIESNDDTNYRFVFAPASGTNKPLYIDSTTTPSSINPNNGYFNIANTISVQLNQTSIGNRAGTTQNAHATAVGYTAGENSQGLAAVAIGAVAGNSNQGDYSVCIGNEAGESTSGISSVLIGDKAGKSASVDNSIVLNATGSDLPSTQSGLFIDPIRAVADPSTINTMYYDTSTKEIVSTPVSATSGSTITNNNSDSDFYFIYADGAGSNKSLYADTSLLPTTGFLQNSKINPYSGAFNITNTITVQQFTTAIGKGAGKSIGDFGCAMGYLAGINGGSGSVAIGSYAGNVNTDGKTDSVLIGYGAGENNAGTNSVLIGKYAGRSSSVDNSIILNATGSNVSSTQAGFYVDPVRVIADPSTIETLYYDTSTKEIVSTPVIDTSGATITESNSDTNYRFVFASASGNNKPLYIDSATTPSSINPNTGYFNIADTIKVDLNRTAIGHEAGASSQQTYATACGYLAGNSNQGTYATACGYQAGNSNQGTYANAFGVNAGKITQGDTAVAIGVNAGYDRQKSKAVAIGNASGYTLQNSEAVAIGYQAGHNTQGYQAIAIGTNSGSNKQGQYSIAIGKSSGETEQKTDSVALGFYAGHYHQGLKSVAIGWEAGKTSQSSRGIAVGDAAGQTSQGVNTISVGVNAGFASQGYESIAIGYQSGHTSQSSECVAVGSYAGKINQGLQAVATGKLAGYNEQGDYSVAVGVYSGNDNQSASSVAVGKNSGQTTQGTQSVAIGRHAGQSNQGDYSVALGANAGNSNQANNTICINASSSVLNTGTNPGLFIKPIRGVNSNAGLRALYYDSNSKEIVYHY